MTKDNFLKIVKSKLSENALEYLLNKRESKGKEMSYKTLEMADYLLPYNDKISIEEKRSLFAIRNRMVNIGSNFGKIENCEKCKMIENMEHIYDCIYLNKQQNEISFEKIYSGNINQQNQILRKFEKNMNERRKIKTNLINNPCDPSLSCDPLTMFSFG